MAENTKTEETKGPTPAELQQQLADAKAELANRQKLEGDLESQLAEVRSKLAAVQAQSGARGSEVAERIDGLPTFRSTVVRVDHQNAKLAEVYPFAKIDKTPPTVTLKSFIVQDAAGANEPIRVDNCCDESEAKRVAYERLKVHPREIRLKAVAADTVAKSQATKVAAAK